MSMPEGFNNTTPHSDLSEELKDELRKVTRWFESAGSNEKDWRAKARIWHDYFHGYQYDEETKKQLKARYQPEIKINLIKSIVNLVSGQEIQGRTDVKFVGFEEGDNLASEILTDIYRQINEETYFSYEQSMAFQDGIIGGRGALWQDWNEDSDEIEREYIDWQEIFWDACSKRVDYRDARHVFHAKWVDLDVAIEMYPDREEELKRVATGGQETADGQYATRNNDETYFDDLMDSPSKWSDPERDRVKLVQCWYYKLNRDTMKSEIYNCVFSDNTFIVDPEPFGRKHRQLPIIPTYFMKDRKGMPYGIVKDLIDTQDIINKSFSKSMHILGTRQILAEKGALPNVAVVQNNINKPDAVIADFEDGSLSNNKVRIEENRGDAQIAFQHFEIGVTAMNRVSGVNPELQGLSSNVRSGTAISMRLRQGNTVLTSVYDALEKTKKKCAEMFISLMAQYMTTKEVMRYKARNGAMTNVEVNGEQEVATAEGIFKVKSNEIKDIFKYDVIITESAKAANANEATINNLVELTKVAPALQQNPAFIAEIIKSTDLPNKDALVSSLMPAPPEGGDATATQ
jgi:hypothetical protein